VAGEQKGDPGDREPFSREALTHIDHLYRVAVHLAKEPHAARDLVQETYARALQAFAQFKPGTNMKAWLTRILYNFFLDDQYQKRKWAPLEPRGGSGTGEDEVEYRQPQAEDPGPEEQFLDKELAGQIENALEKIPEEFRAVVVLVDMADLSYAEAAEVLNCPLGTVRSRLSRGRRYLLKQLEGYVTLD
jgi:RNA polymerase sigma-70 factor (ECF subfamily)